MTLSYGRPETLETLSRIRDAHRALSRGTYTGMRRLRNHADSKISVFLCARASGGPACGTVSNSYPDGPLAGRRLFQLSVASVSDERFDSAGRELCGVMLMSRLDWRHDTNIDARRHCVA